ncbi:hypothetical protein [Nonomuraea sp. NPDC050786]|uniref:hypothetical protein n=1 Tax=Nonomuraea sp. NPDC050786 TaxID=3154840 RepID=UPI0033F1FF21
MHQPTPDQRIPADQINTLTPSQVFADARDAGARPEHALDAVAVAIATLMEPVTGGDFHHLLPGYANDVQSWAHGWLHLNHGYDPRVTPIDYGALDNDVVKGMLDHVAEHARRYDAFAG